MQSKPVYHLFIPNLLQSLESWHNDFLFEAQSGHLSILFKQFDKYQNPKVNSVNSAFFQALDPKVEELPLAYYRHHVQVGSTLKALMCADPVHLEVSMNDVTLTDKIIDLSDEEAKDIIELLNKHFSEDGLTFLFGSNQCWYVTFGEDESVQSHDIDSVLLKNIIDKSTQSPQRNWQVIQNEVQMLLHSSEVNKNREMAGLKPVNSLWFWGAGKPLDITAKFNSVYSNNKSSKLRGEIFAKAANCQWKLLPDNLSEFVDGPKENPQTQAILLDQLFMPALENKLDEFQHQLNHIDENIIKPLLQAWQKNEIDIIIDCCDGTVLKPKRVPTWKFWKKPISLRELSK